MHASMQDVDDRGGRQNVGAHQLEPYNSCIRSNGMGCSSPCMTVCSSRETSARLGHAALEQREVLI